MASTQIKRRIGTSIPISEDASKKKTKVDSERDAEKTRRKSANPYTTPSPKKPKHENDTRHFKFTRKRSHSITGGNGKYLPCHKRRKKEGIIPPTKFLLGGNICDPLNLNSLQDEEINRAVNAVTPRSSPLPTPRHRKEEIQVLIPPNINDPLNLAAGEDGDDFELKLVSPKKRKIRRRRKHLSTSPSAEGKEDQQAPPLPKYATLGPCPANSTSVPSTKTELDDSIPEEQEGQETESNLSRDLEVSPKEKKLANRKTSTSFFEDRKSGGGGRKVPPEAKDKIVSPVVPQPGARKRQSSYGRSISRAESSGGVEGVVEVKGNNESRRAGGKSAAAQGTVVDHGHQIKKNFNKKNVNYQYGNYNRYYGYRNPNHENDARLQFLRQDLFEGKDVLDIGCNVGHVTLMVARDLGARSVVGLDIDKKLIEAAWNNVRHYTNNVGPRNKPHGSSRHLLPTQSKEEEERFPVSMPILYGPINAGASHLTSKGNYVLDCDSLLEAEQPKFDVILCLSVTKWIHLNWGDDGLKRTFRRMFAQLRPGGKLILEPQAWPSYRRKKSITETTVKNYNNISFYPQQFTQYLLSEVGFKTVEVLGMPQHPSRGFQRPIQLFYKDSTSPSREVEESTSTDQGSFESPSSKRSPSQRVDGKKIDDDAPVSVKQQSCDIVGFQEKKLGECTTSKEGIMYCAVMEGTGESPAAKDPEEHGGSDEKMECSSTEHVIQCMPSQDSGTDCTEKKGSAEHLATAHISETCELKKPENTETCSSSGVKGDPLNMVVDEQCSERTVEGSFVKSETSVEIKETSSPSAKGEQEHSEVSL
ncbi:hypothetical protein J437_LFUL011048 [Ladona fulva]|uniref:RNA methyltransferase n=1 Tax=Ladona fulva TaxID=123851 RepID=A0A8K0P0E4_LADFU|nr:hypothetical protein J437_LFUL011048 [Ladona fulva]